VVEALFVSLGKNICTPLSLSVYVCVVFLTLRSVALETEKTFCVNIMDGINAPTILNPGCFPDRGDSNDEPLEWFHFRNAKHGHYVQGMVDLIQADLGEVNVYLVIGLFPMRLLKTSRVARE
jgi:hypothetical protein